MQGRFSDAETATWTTVPPLWLRPIAWSGPVGCCYSSITLSRVGDKDDRRHSANGSVSKWWSVSDSRVGYFERVRLQKPDE